MRPIRVDQDTCGIDPVIGISAEVITAVHNDAFPSRGSETLRHDQA